MGYEQQIMPRAMLAMTDELKNSIELAGSQLYVYDGKSSEIFRKIREAKKMDSAPGSIILPFLLAFLFFFSLYKKHATDAFKLVFV